MTKSWIYIDGKPIPKEDYHGDNVRGTSFQVMPDIEPFISHVDGSYIGTRPHLRAHNKKHGVSNTADYPPEYVAQRKKERLDSQDKQGKQQRIECLSRAYDNPQPLRKPYHMPGPGRPNRP